MNKSVLFDDEEEEIQHTRTQITSSKKSNRRNDPSPFCSYKTPRPDI